MLQMEIFIIDHSIGKAEKKINMIITFFTCLNKFSLLKCDTKPNTKQFKNKKQINNNRTSPAYSSWSLLKLSKSFFNFQKVPFPLWLGQILEADM